MKIWKRVALTATVLLTLTPWVMAQGPIENSHDSQAAIMDLTFGTRVQGRGWYGLWVDNDTPDGNTFGIVGRMTYSQPANDATYGVAGLNMSQNANGYGVYGLHDGAGVGVYGVSDDGEGVLGLHASTRGAAAGVTGQTASRDFAAAGVLGQVNSTQPASNSAGVRGINRSQGSQGSGVSGHHEGKGVGVGGVSGTGMGIYGAAGATGYAGYFNGRVQVTGNLTKGAGAFKIDHPLDPANKYLSHSFVESPDMLNLYNGNIVLDKDGTAVVELPAWFEALNRDFRYQLTPIGGPGPNLYIAEEIKDQRFKIAGGLPGGKVSWQVTGVRHDPFAEQNRIVVEEDKPPWERELYLYPEVYGLPESLAVDYQTRQTLKRP